MRRALSTVCLLLFAACASAPGGVPGQFAAGDDRVTVRLAGAPFCEFRWRGFPNPIVWPLLAPGGVPITRGYPMQPAPGEPTDHPHHRSLWFAHGDVNGVDFWAGDGRIELDAPPELDPGRGAIRCHCTWRDGQGRAVCADEREMRFSGGPDWRAIDVDVTVLANQGELRFGDTKEGTFAVRLRPELCLKGDGARGSVRDSEGRTGDAVWGKAAAWVVYAAPIGAAVQSVAIFDHPDNPASPTHWHARDYGLFAANPFGLHDFAGAPAGKGALLLHAGERRRFRYRVWLHRGEVTPAAVAAARAEWLREA